MENKSIFVQFIPCRDCIYMFKISRNALALEHYTNRKNIKRCIGCEELQLFYKERVQVYEQRKINKCK